MVLSSSRLNGAVLCSLCSAGEGGGGGNSRRRPKRSPANLPEWSQEGGRGEPGGAGAEQLGERRLSDSEGGSGYR